MSKEQVLGVIRHVLTFAGGFFVTKGLVDDGLLVELVGGIITVVGGIWSVIAKKTA